MDYNESTPLPSPHSGDEHSVLMGNKSPIAEAPNLEEASMLPDNEEHASSPAPTSAATVTECAAPKGAVASLGVNPMSDVQTVHNGEPDSDESKPMALPTLNRSQSVSLARCREGGYVSGGSPRMPPPSKWSHSSVNSATRLRRANIDDNKLFSVYPSWKTAAQSTRLCYPYPRLVAF